MTAPDEDDLSALRARAADAASAETIGAHVDDATLARIARDDEDPSLDGAFRHLSTCATCRARLTSGDEGRRVVAAAARPRAMERTRRPSPAVLFAAVAALAAAAAIFLLIRGPRSDAPVDVSQRWFTGTMGTTSASVAPADRDLELSVPDDGREVAVVFHDDAGHVLGKAQWLELAADGRRHAVVAPRTFASPGTRLHALVLAGAHPDVAKVLDAAPTDAARVRELADANEVHVQAVDLAP